MIEDNFDLCSRVRARFEPKRMDNLRPCMVPLVGRTFEFECYGTMDQGDYDGQTIWFMDRKHDTEILEESRGYWSPREDLEIVEVLR